MSPADNTLQTQANVKSIQYFSTLPNCLMHGYSEWSFWLIYIGLSLVHHFFYCFHGLEKGTDLWSITELVILANAFADFSATVYQFLFVY